MKFNLNSGKPLPFKDKTFDEVRLHYVIQHLLYSQEVLEECGRVLKKGGELDLTFPDCESLFYWLFPIRDNPVRGGGPHMTNGSSYGIWNVNMMTNRLRAAGFRVAETTKYGRSATNLFLSNPAVHMRCIKE
jgi:SAM-dependent methyltransferase